ncbi:hypothetical protein VB566_00220 [Clostridium perfringens]|uniref:hypothetical protein n=1 Tax=Clostridium perfringens TaxID=1502 RepID=UPI002B20053F|nr:hypothetical protein [Clostridium perfringens]MEA5269386.1 hypothetical protein [Clostridium perfringens]MEA5309311.1 hypothetical protein [Clostridium perfringens]MEA5339866.1 hypothetical protein [Clostridium perfringens]
MSKFAEECKKRIAEAGVEPREIKVEVNYLPIHGRKLEEDPLGALKIEKFIENLNLEEIRKAPVVIERMAEEFKNPSECQKLYEANLQLEEVKKEANYWETKCRKINKVLVKYRAENKEISNIIVDLEHENAHLKIRYEESLKKETKFESSYVKKHSELVKEAAELRKENETLIKNYELLHGAYTNVEKNATELREEKGNLNRTLELLNEHIETIENNTSVFIDEINTLWGEIVNIDLESKEGKEKFKELQIQVAKSKNLLDLAFSIK